MKTNSFYRNKTSARLIAFTALFVAACMLFSGCSIAKRIIIASLERTKTPEPIPTEEPTPVCSPTPGPTRDPGEKVPHTNPEAFADVVLPRESELYYFAIPDQILYLMTDGDIIMYKNVVTAYLAGLDYAELPSEAVDDYPNLWRVVDMYFPVFFSDVDDTTISLGRGRITWRYRGTPEQHEAAIADFEETVEDFLSAVDRGDTLLMQILEMYKAYTSVIEYNGARVDPDDDDSPYVYRHSVDALMERTGVCWCFARAFNFLICQLGAESLTVHGLRRGDMAIHEWVVFRHGDKWRYCDPTWDIGGTSLNYFGFTIAVRERNGFPKNGVTVLEGREYLASSYFNVTDGFFAPLFTGACSGADYELSPEDNRIVFLDYGYFSTKLKPVSYFDIETGEHGNID